MFLVFDWWLDVNWLKSHRNATYCIDFSIVIRILNTPVSAKIAQGQRKWRAVLYIKWDRAQQLIYQKCYLAIWYNQFWNMCEILGYGNKKDIMFDMCFFLLPYPNSAYIFQTHQIRIPYKAIAMPTSGPRLNIKTVLSTYGDFHVKDKTAVRTSYL